MSNSVLRVTEKPFAAAAVDQIDELLKGGGFVLDKLEKYTEKRQLLEKIGQCKPYALIVRTDKIDMEVLQAGKETGLELIVRAGAGFDTIDTAGARGLGITVMNTPGANANAVAELVFGMVITTARNHYDGTSGWELRGKRIALYGFGAVARNVARIAKGIGMTVVAGDPFLTKEQMCSPVGENPGADEAIIFKQGDTVETVTNEQLLKLFSGCHIVSLHVPATETTKGSITGELVKSMGAKGCLVNTARKEVSSVSILFSSDQKCFGFCTVIKTQFCAAPHFKIAWSAVRKWGRWPLAKFGSRPRCSSRASSSEELKKMPKKQRSKFTCSINSRPGGVEGRLEVAVNVFMRHDKYVHALYKGSVLQPTDEVVDEASVGAAMGERTDLTYICDVGLSTDIQTTLGDKRVMTTAKKMGAQTAEANNNAGSMAAVQISQFKSGDAACQRCIVNKA
eukprot:gene106-749_t